MDDLKSRLLAPRLPEDDVQTGVGAVRVRGVTLDEQHDLAKIADVKLRDFHLIAIGMVNPRLSVSEVRAWDAAAGSAELMKVRDRIGQLSGMIEGQAKEAYKEMEANPDAEFRDVLGAETGDDGRPAEG